MHQGIGAAEALPSLWVRVSRALEFNLATELEKLLREVAELHALVVGTSHMAEFIADARKAGELEDVALFVVGWLDADFEKLSALYRTLMTGRYLSGSLRAILHRVLGPGPPCRSAIGVPAAEEVAA